MLGVLANPQDADVARELFELFKTPWELYRAGHRYDVLLSATEGALPDAGAPLILVYSGRRTDLDDAAGIELDGRTTGTALAYGRDRLPLYGRCLTFGGPGIGLAVDAASGAPAAGVARRDGARVVRVGYDLFSEVRRLLTEGQPPANAGVPTLDLHIALLRELMTWSATPLVEIPPAPSGRPFIACLTHDVDHPSLRRHRWDHTALGFLFRATIGSVVRLCRGRASLRDVLASWAAALRLPLVHLGLARDIWADWPRYRALDGGAGSTFFVIPAGHYAGQTSSGGPAPARRAAGYGARDVAGEIERLTAAGCEIGVHGIDAWLDSGRGRAELAEVARLRGAPGGGVRMHWLYASDKSPLALEEAGFAYDSTSGYNETVGYRAGTTQVWKPLGATALLELPLHVMDTALFYPGHLDLSPGQARQRVGDMIDHALSVGGVVTVNWHDRSVAPERLWGRVYAELVEDLRASGAWLPTASQAVAWFRKRRAAVFESVRWDGREVAVRVSAGGGDELPGLRLRVHRPAEHGGAGVLGAPARGGYVDVTMPHGIDARIRM